MARRELRFGVRDGDRCSQYWGVNAMVRRPDGVLWFLDGVTEAVEADRDATGAS
jgi:hypothetical protein